MMSLDSALGMTVQLADIERIRRILKQDKLILVGHSFGGFLATLYTLEFPEQVQKMVLISPAGLLQFPPAYGGMDQVKSYLNEEMQKEYESFRERYFDYGKIFTKSEEQLAGLNAEYARFYEEALRSKGVSLPAEVTRARGIGGWSAHALYFSLGWKFDYRNKLKSITAPALVIHGAKDVYTEEIGREYADLLPKGKLAVIGEACHFAFASLVADFLKEKSD